MMKILVGVFMGTFLWYTANFLSMYLPYLAEEIQTNEIVFSKHPILKPKNATRRLEYLNELVEMPLIGRFFMEEKIKELVTLNRFNASLVESQSAIADPFNSRSFSIWYHKALSECILGLIAECQNSLTWASLYSDQFTEQYVQEFYKAFEIAQEKGIMKRVDHSADSEMEEQNTKINTSQLQEL